MDLFRATRAYEAWVAAQGPTRRADFGYKHARMAESPFQFLRGAYYRWAELFPSTCPDAMAAPAVLAIGDLHIENLGTWRDAVGRLAWGVNDFDEAHRLPYTNDLVRLAASVRLGVRAGTQIPFRRACQAILRGYADGLRRGGEPFVLEERHPVLRKQAVERLRDAVLYWDKLQRLPRVRGRAPARVKGVLRSALPERGPSLDLRWRRAGTGSLGRARVVALTDWRGGLVAREAKTAAGPANAWLERPHDTHPEIRYNEIVERAVRSPDPCLRLQPGWIVRRLAHDCSRVELSSLPARADQAEWLQAMGAEAANVHLGSRADSARVARDLERRDPAWLRQAARAMLAVTRREHAEWAARYRSETTG
jgi:hypothetical protein